MLQEGQEDTKADVVADNETGGTKSRQGEDPVSDAGEPKAAKGQKRARTCVPNWPRLPELLGPSNGSADVASGGTGPGTQPQGPCDVWPGEVLVWPASVPVSVTVSPGRCESLAQHMTRLDQTQVRVNNQFWQQSTNDLPMKPVKNVFTLKKNGNKQILHGQWKFTSDNLYDCETTRLKFCIDWDAEWLALARARQHRWGTQPSMAVPAFMRHLESMAGRYCRVNTTQLRAMGYPMLTTRIMAFYKALNPLKGRWYCRSKTMTGLTIPIAEGFLVHPQPNDLLIHALALDCPQKDAHKCTLIIHDTDKLLLPTRPDIVRINTLADLGALNRKALKRGSLTLMVHRFVLSNLPPYDHTNEFAQYNVRKQHALPTLFTDIQWGRLLVLSHTNHPPLPQLQCTFRWTLRTPDLPMQVCHLGHLDQNPVLCNRHCMLQFVDL